MTFSGKGKTVAVIGGGFSGAAVALHLLRRHGQVGRIILFDPSARLGAGLAYGTRDPAHRINVPASRMSIDPADPGSFQRFAVRDAFVLADPDVVGADGELYPSRAVFGAYVASELQPHIAGGAIEHRRALVVSVLREAESWRITDEHGANWTADILVLATTHPMPKLPAPLRAVADHPHLVADASKVEAISGIEPDDRVLIVGNGLTSADVIASLSRLGHRGSIVAISRRGLRSRGHAPVSQDPHGDFSTQPAKTASEVLRHIRVALRTADAANLSWHAVIDAVRAQALTIWQALPVLERRRLARHARPYWDVHRFRIAPQVEQVVETALATDQLRILAAAVTGVEANGRGFRVHLRIRGKGHLEVDVDRIVVTTGPAHDTILNSQPFLRDLAKAGHLQLCPTGLGIACDLASRAIRADGTADPSLLIAGPLARGTFGELMGLPQVAEHAVFVADHVAETLAAVAQRRSGSVNPPPSQPDQFVSLSSDASQVRRAPSPSARIFNMAAADKPLDFLWFIPSSGDGAYLGSDELARPADPGYFREIARAVDRLGYSGVLIPTGVACEESFILAADLAAHTEQLKFLVAIRPGVASPAYYARLTSTLDRVSNGRLLLNIVVGGSAQELAGDGIFLPHDERYAHADEFFQVFNGLIENGKAHLDGKYIQAHNAELGLPPVQSPRPPIYFGGSSDAAIDFSAGIIDKYLTWGEPPAQVAEKVEKVKRAAAKGRQVSFGIRLHFIVRETDEEAWAAADRLISRLSDETIAAAQEVFAKNSDSVGQARMVALHQGRRDKLEVSPNLWAGIGLVRSGAGTALVGSPKTIAARLREYQEIGIDTVIASGYPHLEEAYRVSELLFPEIGLAGPRNQIRSSFGKRQVFGGGGHGGNVRVASGS